MSEEQEIRRNEKSRKVILRRPRRSESGRRVVRHNWRSEEVRALITAVQKRPSLWDTSLAEYSFVKHGFWLEVIEEIGLEITVKEAKSKWGCLRVTFKANLSKFHTKKSNVQWKYFKQMMFLDKNENKNSASSVSSEDHEFSALVKEEYKEELSMSEPETSTQFSASASQSFLPKTHLTITNSSVSALQSSDKNLSFCNYLLCQLRHLPENDADRLRNGINRYLLDFLDSIQVNLPHSSSV